MGVQSNPFIATNAWKALWLSKFLMHPDNGIYCPEPLAMGSQDTERHRGRYRHSAKWKNLS